jgi:threonine dehydrogenase-like Zn-dependent dehydrogenase
MKALVFELSLPRAGALMSLGRASQKLFYDSPLSLISIKDVDEPVLPGPDWVKVKTAACGFCASDLNLIFLRESLTASPFSSFPCTMGHEMCGTVVEAGAGVDNAKQGDMVAVAPILSCATRGIDPVCAACAKGLVCNCENFARGNLAPGMFLGLCKDVGGGLAPYFVAHKSQVFVMPKGTRPETGAMMEPFCVGLAAVLGSRPADGEKVLVIGGGVIGNAVVRAIRALGADCKITVADPSPFAAGVARLSGADSIIASGDIIAEAPALTGGTSYKPLMGKNILMGGFDRIFDTVGSSNTLNAAMRCLAAGGEIMMLGIGASAKLDLTALWLKKQTIKGTLAYGFEPWKGKSLHVYEIALELIKKGKVRLDDLVTHRFALAEYKRQIEVNLAKGRHQAMKTITWFD